MMAININIIIIINCFNFSLSLLQSWYLLPHGSCTMFPMRQGLLPKQEWAEKLLAMRSKPDDVI